MTSGWRCANRWFPLGLLLGSLVVACGQAVVPTPTPVRPLSATATARAAAATAEVQATSTTVAALAVSTRTTTLPGADAAIATLTMVAAQARTATAVAPTVVTTMPPDSPVTFAWQIMAEPGKLERVTRLTIDNQGYLYLLDVMLHRILKYDQDGRLVTSWGGEGVVDGRFSFRYTSGVNVGGFAGALAADQQGNIYVVDGLHRIQKFDTNGNFILAWGGEGASNGMFSRPFGVATDRLGNVYVADGDNARVQKFNGQGRFLTTWGTPGSGDGQFSFRLSFGTSSNVGGGIAVDGQGHVYVSDLLQRIQKFDSNGAFISQWGVRGNRPAEFDGSVQLAADGRGTIYASDSRNYRVQVFNGEGNYLAQWGLQGSGVGQFNVPAGIAVDPQGAIYVAESFTNPRIQKFLPKGPWSTATRGTPTPRPPTPLPTSTPPPLPTATTGVSRPPSMTPTER